MITLVIVQAINPESLEIETLRVTSGTHYVEGQNLYRPDLTEYFNFTQSLFGANVVNLTPTVGYGTVTFNNLNLYYNKYASYGFDSKPIEVYRLKDEDTQFNQAQLIFSGKVDYPELNYEHLELNIESKQQDLAKIHQPAKFVYEEVNYLSIFRTDGVEELNGQTKPQIWGKCFNIPLYLLNKYQLLYACNFDYNGDFRSVSAFLGVYNKGGAYKFHTNVDTLDDLFGLTIPASHYATCNALGLVRLGTVPTGEVTADVLEAPEAECTVSRLVGRILQSKGFTVTDYSEEQLDLLGSVCTLPAGYYITGDETTFDIISNMLNSIAAWMIPDNLGYYHFGYLKYDLQPTAEKPVIDSNFRLDNTLKLLQPPTTRGLPCKNLVFNHTPNWKVLNEGSTLETLSKPRRLKLSNPNSSLVVESSDLIKLIHPSAEEFVVNTLFNVEASVRIEDEEFFGELIWWDSYADVDCFITFAEGPGSNVRLATSNKGICWLKQSINIPAFSYGTYYLRIVTGGVATGDCEVEIEVEGLNPDVQNITLDTAEYEYLIPVNFEGNHTLTVTFNAGNSSILDLISCQLVREDLDNALLNEAIRRHRLLGNRSSYFEFKLHLDIYNQLNLNAGSEIVLSEVPNQEFPKAYQVCYTEFDWSLEEVTLRVWRVE